MNANKKSIKSLQDYDPDGAEGLNKLFAGIRQASPYRLHGDAISSDY